VGEFCNFQDQRRYIYLYEKKNVLDMFGRGPSTSQSSDLEKEHGG
jgi:hypothetical protein